MRALNDTNQQTNQISNEVADQRPSIYKAIPALTASLAQEETPKTITGIMLTLTLPTVVKLNASMLRPIVYYAMGLI
jgi:hypothetical protein